MTARVVDEHVLGAERLPGDTATCRTTLARAEGRRGLEQRSILFARGRSAERRNDAHDEVMYVAAGAGTLWLEGSPHELAAETGVYVAAGERYAVDNPHPADLHVVSVLVPAGGGPGGGGRRRVTVPASGQSVHTTGDREFRVLVDPEAGCAGVTQFVGAIPPGRAPAHHHPYDEVVYVVGGQGLAHVGGQSRPIAAGTCLHLPAGVPHCLENNGSGALRVLGVFHPAGSPAAKMQTARRHAGPGQSTVDGGNR